MKKQTLKFSLAVCCILGASSLPAGNFLDDVLDVVDTLAEPSVTNVQTATGIENGRPKGTSRSFPADTSAIYVWFSLSGAVKGAELQSVWYFNDNGNLKKIANNVFTVEENKKSWGEFHLEITQGNRWPAGDYRVDIMLKSKNVATANFSVTSASKGTGASWSGQASTGNTSTNSTVQPAATTPTATTQPQTSGGGLDDFFGSGAAAAPSTPAAAPAATVQSPAAVPSASVQGTIRPAAAMKLYSEANGGYSISYPADWSCSQPSTYATSFTQPEGNAEVNIQTLLSAASGGKYKTSVDIIADFKKQLTAAYSDARFSADKDCSVGGIAGRDFVAEYTMNGLQFRQRFVIVLSPDGKLFRSFFYLAPLSTYEKHSLSAKSMLESWRFGTPAATPSATPPATTPAPAKKVEDFSF